MTDIIELLPDSVANQIAAGEVIQRPASVVKELIENAIDAGASNIEVNIKNAGRTLIQIVDNGSGMSDTDARLCFERHATSKIKTADDLFHLQTKGFRGEALASIAAIAHVELRTKKEDKELGTLLLMEGCKCLEQSACNCEKGSSFMVKNLFFNVPARRNFLKSDNVEFGHIQEEFLRVALVHHNISFTLYHNEKIEYQLVASSLKQRIVNIFGKHYQEKLIPINQNMNLVNIQGYITKPEFAKKTRGEQYLFVNQRFIKHPYFHHAIMSAFEELIPSGTFPSYFIYFDINPEMIDINIHPTKTEVKFQEERNIYSILLATIKHSIGVFNLNPSLDFENVSPIEFSENKNNIISQPTSFSNPDYNPFDKKTFNYSSKNISQNQWKSNNEGWEKIYSSIQENIPEEAKEIQQSFLETDTQEDEYFNNQENVFQVLDQYIVGQLKSGFIVIDVFSAMERILYERYLAKLDNNLESNIQKLLFPETLNFSPQNAEVVKELLPHFLDLGFEIEEFGKNTFILNGVPTDFQNKNAQQVIDTLLAAYNSNLLSLKISKKNNLAHSFARSINTEKKKKLSMSEMQNIISELFKTTSPNISPSGNRICFTFNDKELLRLFQ